MSVFNFKRVFVSSSCMWKTDVCFNFKRVIFHLHACGVGRMSVLIPKRCYFPSSHVWRTDVCFNFRACSFPSSRAWRTPVSVLAGSAACSRGRPSVVTVAPLPAQARRAAACGSSAPCPSSFATLTTSATSASRNDYSVLANHVPEPMPMSMAPHQRGEHPGPSSAGECSPSEQTHG